MGVLNTLPECDTVQALALEPSVAIAMCDRLRGLFARRLRLDCFLLAYSMKSKFVYPDVEDVSGVACFLNFQSCFAMYTQWKRMYLSKG
jgi:hypothetical protein